MNTLFTIGYAGHKVHRFTEMLVSNDITILIDVRSNPHSKYNPDYNSKALENHLFNSKIAYVHLGRELGAQRVERECYINGKVDYSLVEELPPFRMGIRKVLKSLENHNVVLMCAEKDPVNCHRTILICHNLRNAGISIKHILHSGKIEENSETEKRLREMLRVEPTLFEGPRGLADLVEKAYNIQAKKIAYVESMDKCL